MIFTGNKFTKNGHLETLLPSVFRKIKVPYTRFTLNLPDGDFLDLDFLKKDNTKILVLFHGLEGSANSNYIKGFATKFSQLGYDICAVNFRSCSGRLNKYLPSYHSGATQDLSAIFKHLHTLNYTKIFAGGFSLGGNVLLKFLGEPKDYEPKIIAAFAFSTPIDLTESTTVLAQPKNKMYMQFFLKSLQEKIKAKAKQFPNQIDLTNLDKIKTFTEWDNAYTAPHNGFKDAFDYYQKSSAINFIPNIATPTLLVNAQNDPFLGKNCLTQNNFPVNFIFETPKHGGHCGFSYAFPNGKYYSEERVLTFLNNL